MKFSLGIDAGSRRLGLVLLDGSGNIVRSWYGEHEGRLTPTLLAALRAVLPPEVIHCYAATGCLTSGLPPSIPRVEGIAALWEGVAAVAGHSPDSIRHILHIGAGSFHLIDLDARGRYLNHRANSSCAAGTGSFLDQQARRLNTVPEKLAELASGQRRCPNVASRCTVFAKSDMIHLQQAGYSPAEIAAGLCSSLGRSTVESLLMGRSCQGPVAFIGGVALNPLVRDAVARAVAPQRLWVPRLPHLAGALGAARLAERRGRRAPLDPGKLEGEASANAAARRSRPPLALRQGLSRRASFHREFLDPRDNEVLLPRPLPPGPLRVFLGIDIGSTSTKCVLLDAQGAVRVSLYRRTAGDPITAVRHLLAALAELQREQGTRFDFGGVGTTGSGRKLIRHVLSADLEKNEITAHARAALFLDPEVDTIIEIGGQDSKFTQLQDGMVYNSVMNYVCAAGTGSFIEEQAARLGIPLAEYSERVIGRPAPFTSDRCTVFMEQDLERLLASGVEVAEAAAAVLHSVRDNYLNKVVAGLSLGRRIYFQGATARNQALVAAFEERLGREILVDPFCHVTGALGMALFARELALPASGFIGLGFAEAPLSVEHEVCELCRNRCEMTLVQAGERRVAWGLQCGREYEDERPRVRRRPGLRPYTRARELLAGAGGASPARRGNGRNRVVGIPLALTGYGYRPLFEAFFQELGCEPRFTAPGGERYRRGKRLATEEVCAPVVIAHGHVAELAADGEVDLLFLPHLIREACPPGLGGAHFCPHVQAYPSVASSLQALEARRSEILRPVVQFGWPLRRQVAELQRALGPALGVGRREVGTAWRRALRILEERRRRLLDLGREVLAELEGSGDIGVVLLGRPYNLYDPELQLNVPEKVADSGLTVIPLDLLPLDTDYLRRAWPTMYWLHGLRILSAAETIRRHPRLFGLFFTNFACGPDSYLLTYFKHVMKQGRKPWLVLQFDGLGADAGYMTRVEAAVETFRSWAPGRGVATRAPEVPAARPRPAGAPGARREGSPRQDGRLVLIPRMDPLGSGLFAAAFNGHRREAEILPEDESTFAEGLRNCSGGECAPCPSTLGGLIHAVRERGLDPRQVAYFLPTASGPCRFGQYRVLGRLVLDGLGWDGLEILSPTDEDSYGGLDPGLRRALLEVVVITDALRACVHRLRPYEAVSGDVDQEVAERLPLLADSFRSRRPPAPVFQGLVERLSRVPRRPGRRPLVGVVGEIYARANDFLNRNLFRQVEELGGEVLLAPLLEFFLYVAHARRRGLFRADDRLPLRQGLDALVKEVFYQQRQRLYQRLSAPILLGRNEPPIEAVMAAGSRHLPPEFGGEAILTVGRAIVMIEEEGVEAVINASPLFCMPGTIASAILRRVEAETGVPVICNYYDGCGDPNRALAPHLHFLTEGARRGPSRARREGPGGNGRARPERPAPPPVERELPLPAPWTEPQPARPEVGVMRRRGS